MAAGSMYTTCKATVLCALIAAGALSGCGTGDSAGAGTPTATTTTTSNTAALPGTGRPAVTIGDKNFTEQFVLGELYSQALEAQGYTVMVNRNIGPSEVTMQALSSHRLDMYPEYLSTWDTSIGGAPPPYRSVRAAYRAGQEYAAEHGLELLEPTPASSTGAIGVTNAYALDNGLHSLGDLRRVAPDMALGAPPQFQTSPNGLPLLQQVYGFTPASFKPLDVGAQYQALDQGIVQAANVGTTDGTLTTGRYTLLRDPRHAFGWGNIVPVVASQVLAAEGPAFGATINRVSALLTTRVMRRLNAAVDQANQDPKVVAQQFLKAHGLVPANAPAP